jgi:hypothetical protein
MGNSSQTLVCPTTCAFNCTHPLEVLIPSYPIQRRLLLAPQLRWSNASALGTIVLDGSKAHLHTPMQEMKLWYLRRLRIPYLCRELIFQGAINCRLHAGLCPFPTGQSHEALWWLVPLTPLRHSHFLDYPKALPYLGCLQGYSKT